MTKWFLILTTLLLLLTACGANGEQFTILKENNTLAQEVKPELKIDVRIVKGKAILFVNTDLIVSQDHYGKALKQGEGHIHVYVNNGAKQGVAELPYELKDVKQGVNLIRVSLHNNDHTPYGVYETLEFEMK
jgi:hypothetical protein